MYRLGIWLVVFALVFNGVMAAAEIEPSDEPVSMAQGHAAGALDMNCDAHAGDTFAAMRHGGQHDPAHNHLKCCARCSMVSLLPGVVAVPAALVYGDAVFYPAQHDLVGRPVALDPHIPKPIV